MQSLILSPSFSTALWASLWASLRASYSNGFCPHDRDLHLHPVIDSTNTEARRRAASDGDRVTLDIAGEQTGGRGRLGRSFHSPGGTGLYMTLGYTLHGPRTAAVTVTAQAAVAVSAAVLTSIWAAFSAISSAAAVSAAADSSAEMAPPEVKT